VSTNNFKWISERYHPLTVPRLLGSLFDASNEWKTQLPFYLQCPYLNITFNLFSQNCYASNSRCLKRVPTWTKKPKINLPYTYTLTTNLILKNMITMLLLELMGDRLNWVNLSTKIIRYELKAYARYMDPTTMDWNYNTIPLIISQSDAGDVCGSQF